MASAAEAELGAIFVNGQDAVPIRTTLDEMNHPQPPTPIQVDNATAVGIANRTIKQRQSKSMDMRFYWVTDRINQGQFLVYWRPGKTNLGDYHSKHHPPAHHIQVRPTYLYTKRYPHCKGVLNPKTIQPLYCGYTAPQRAIPLTNNELLRKPVSIS